MKFWGDFEFANSFTKSHKLTYDSLMSYLVITFVCLADKMEATFFFVGLFALVLLEVAHNTWKS